MQLNPIIEGWLQKQKIKSYGLLEYNERKGRYCVWFEENGVKKILKWNSQDTEEHRKHELLLKKEQQVYQALDGTNLTPKCYEKCFFILDFVDGQTLRSYIKRLNLKKEWTREAEDAYEIISKTLLKWQEFVEKMSHVPMNNLSTIEPKKEFLIYLKTLLFYGPFETQKLSKYCLFRNRIILKLYLFVNRKILKFFEKISFSKQPEIITHGDFHANNILVRNSDVYLIDLENVQKGTPEMELAYMCAQIGKLIQNNSELTKRLDDFIDNNIKIIDKQSFKKVLRSYNFIIRFNRRFS